MSHNPNTIESQSELNTCNDGKRSSDVLVETISKLETTTAELEKTKKQLECGINRELLFLKKIERLEKQLEIAVWALYLLLSGKKTIKIGKSEELIETYALNKIEELNK